MMVAAGAGPAGTRSVGQGGAALSASLREHFAALPAAWSASLAPVLAMPAGQALIKFVDARLAAGAVVFPAQPLAALHATAPREVRAVILGQDPYHGPGQAHGYAFSVLDGVRPPPSLRNILAEVARDCGCAATRTGDLRGWSRQGVLLLNAVLTVEQGAAASHAGRGWECITDAIVDVIIGQPAPKVFLLWGAYAQAKRERILAASQPSLVMQANHPSPLSARRPPVPFLGCGHFSRANAYLLEHGLAQIDWCA
jgi:uracil-DNA glycosylase